MKKKGKLIIIGTGLCMILGGSLFAWHSRSSAKSAVSYKEIAVTRGNLKIAVFTTGTVQPENRLQIKPPIGGRIEQIAIKEGDTVKKGQTLALMSSTDRAALIDAARARGPEELAHWEEIYKTAPLIAPMKGLIIANNVEPGQTISTQDVAFVMSDHLLVLAQVDETDMAKITLGQAADITLDAYPDQRITAKVTHIAFEARTVNNVTMYDVQVTPAQIPDAMRSGMTANVSFKVAEKNDVLVLPISALHKDQEQALVYLKTVDWEQHKTRVPDAAPVQTGLSDGRTVEIVTGLKENDVVLQPVASRDAKKTETTSNPFSPFGGPPKSGSRSGGAPPPPPH